MASHTGHTGTFTVRSLFAAAIFLTLFSILPAHSQVTQRVKVLEPGSSTLMGMPFADPKGSNNYTIGEVINGQLNGGFSFTTSDNLLKWHQSNQAYVIYWQSSFSLGEWRKFPEGSNTVDTLTPGEGFELVNNSSTAQVFIFSGKVPGTNEFPSRTATMPILEGGNLLAYPFPTTAA